MGYSPLLHVINKLIRQGKTNDQIVGELALKHNMDLDTFTYLIFIQRKRVANEDSKQG